MENVLYISSRLPPLSEEKKGVFGFLKILNRDYRVDILYSQGMFTSPDKFKEYEKAGFNLIDLRKDIKQAGIDRRLKNILAGRYEIVILSNRFDAKFYLSYIKDYAPEAVTVYIAGSDNFLRKIKHQKEFPNHITAAVYNFFDYILTDDPEEKNVLMELARETDVVTYEPAKFSAGSLRRQNKHLIAKDEIGIAVIGTPDSEDVIVPGKSLLGENLDISYHSKKEGLIRVCNDVLQRRKNKYILITAAGSLIPEAAVQSMLLCLKSCSAIGMVEPVSADMDAAMTQNDIELRLKKHKRHHFADWSEIKQLNEICLFLRRDLVEEIGLLDTDYNTLECAKTDFCWRAIGKGIGAVTCRDVLVFNKYGRSTKNKRNFEEDVSRLKKKWGRINPDLVNAFRPENIKCFDEYTNCE